MDEKLSQYFGHIIAFLIPGMIGMYGLSYFEPAIREWFGLAAARETTVGGFLFVMLGSVGIGVFISGVRWYICDHWFCIFPPAVQLQHEKREVENKEKAYQDARAQHYMFYLFYSNLFVALPLLFVSWFLRAQPRPQWSSIGLRFVLLIGVCWILYLCAKDCLAKFDEKAARILGVVAPPSPKEQ